MTSRPSKQWAPQNHSRPQHNAPMMDSMDEEGLVFENVSRELRGYSPDSHSHASLELRSYSPGIPEPMVSRYTRQLATVTGNEGRVDSPAAYNESVRSGPLSMRSYWPDSGEKSKTITTGEDHEMQLIQTAPGFSLNVRIRESDHWRLHLFSSSAFKIFKWI